MQPRVERILTPNQSSFTCRSYDLQAFPFNWHVHPEVELTLITQGRGRRFVGDHIGDFGPGDLVLLGSELPHTWYSAPPEGSSEGRSRARAVVIQFRRDFLGTEFQEAHEMQAFRRLLDRASQGLRFRGAAAREIGQRIVAMPTHSGLPRLIELLAIFDALTRVRRCETLATRGFRRGVLRNTDRQRIDIACELINRSYTGVIRQRDVADAVAMTPGAFSRFFRRSTGHSFAGYLHELRVGHACRLLMETDRSITDICFASGFANISNFNRVFLRLKGQSPRRYREALGRAAA